MRLIIALLFAVVAIAQTTINIDSGSSADQYFIGGTASTTTPATAGVDPTSRYGNFSYLVPALSGTPYLVSFTWSDQVSNGSNQRLFRVTVNDQIMFDNFDIYASCGGKNVQCTRAVITVPTTGLLKIVFLTQKRNASVSAISLAPLAIQGPAGPQGPPGPQGPAGSAGNVTVSAGEQNVSQPCPSGYTGPKLVDGSGNCLTVLPSPPSSVKGK